MKAGERDEACVVRDFSGRRWLSVFLRGAHLISVISFSASILGSSHAPHGYAGNAVVITGVLIMLLDVWHRPSHLIEGAGLSMLLKLALLAGMLVLPELREALFWVIVGWSAFFSHAPARFRNARWMKLRQ